MTFASLTTSTRRAKPSHEPWQAHAYQRRASEFLRGQGAAALFLDPGLGKTSIVLDAFNRLKQAGIARKMLVVAPLRVCQTVWRQEAQKWTEFRDLRISLLHGDKKADRLKDDADVWLINPEGVKWLRDKMLGHGFPFDTVVLDELTKFKNHSADRSKFIRALIKHAPRRWGLTGSPAPNGYMDLFGQMLALDDGAALGKYITHYRDQYFQVDYDGFTYDLQPGAAKRIEDRLRPYVLRMSAEEYLELPPLVDDVRELDMEPAARKTYSTMKKDMLAELPEGVVTGANAAAVYSKLKQMANGAVYVNDAHDVAQIHNTKLDALDDLVEELAGGQLLIAYEFQHDVERLKKHFSDKLSVISGASENKINVIVDAWNAGRIELLACHPASAAHGLNLQYSGCAHVCWFSPPWDLELYQQFIRRIHRQGNEAQRVVNHLLCVKDTIDELALAALRDKDTTQSRLLRGLNTEILRDAETQAGGVPVETRTVQMTVAKLSRQSDAGGGEPRKIIPRGWGKAAEAANEDPAPADDTAQRQRIQAKLTGADTQEADEGPSMADKARAAFSPAVRQHMAQMEGDALSENQYVDKGGTIREKSAAEEPARSTFGKRGQLDIDIEDVAPATQRPAQGDTQEAETPTRASRKRAPAASVGPAAVDSVELRLSLVAIAGGDVMKARQMLEFVTGA